MPYVENEIEKIYFTVGEVAEMLNVNRSLIRFWEGEFEELNPGRRRNKFREFTKEDVEMVKKIYHLLKVRRFTIEGAKLELRGSNGLT